MKNLFYVLLMIIGLSFPIWNLQAAETKEVCKDVKLKDGKTKKECKTIKVHKKLEGKEVPKK